MAAESVTIWTSAHFLETQGKSKAKSEIGFYFESHTYYQATAFEIPEYLNARLVSAQRGKVPFLVIASIEGSPEWLHSALAEVLPMMRSDSSRDLLNKKRWEWERGTIVLPVVDKEHEHMSFFMQYPMILSNDDSTATTAHNVHAPVMFCPLATWIGTWPPDTLTTQIPAIVMACQDDEVVHTLQKQCVSGNWKLEQLCHGSARIFVDLFTHLAQWPDVWGSARRELGTREAQLHGETGNFSILQQTRALHRDAAGVIAMREDLRLHITAFQKLGSLLKASEHRQVSHLFGLADEAEREEFVDQVKDCLQNLQHQQESSAVIHKQLENLLSLAFNTEMVSQGQAVTRLNTLAFGFLPLSWVATLFGMTNFSISSVWHPLWAFIILVLVLLAAYLTKKFSQWRLKRTNRRLDEAHKITEATKTSKRTKPTKPDKPVSKPENIPPKPETTTTPSQPSPSQRPLLPPPSPAPSPKPHHSRLNPIRYPPWGRKHEYMMQSTLPPGQAIAPHPSFPIYNPTEPKVAMPTNMDYLSVATPTPQTLLTVGTSTSQPFSPMAPAPPSAPAPYYESLYAGYSQVTPSQQGEASMSPIPMLPLQQPSPSPGLSISEQGSGIGANPSGRRELDET